MNVNDLYYVLDSRDYYFVLGVHDRTLHCTRFTLFSRLFILISGLAIDYRFAQCNRLSGLALPETLPLFIVRNTLIHRSSASVNRIACVQTSPRPRRFSRELDYFYFLKYSYRRAVIPLSSRFPHIPRLLHSHLRNSRTQRPTRTIRILVFSRCRAHL